MGSKAIYLHIFDREFRTFTNSKLKDEVACRTVMMASLLSDNPYAGMGNLMESQPEFPYAVKLFYELEKIEEATIVSSTAYPEEFIEGRRKLYYDDKERYPMYFEDKSGLLLPKYVVPLQDSTTTILEGKLAKQLREENAPRIIQNVKGIKNAILNRDESGITIGILGRHTSLTPVEHKWLGEQISTAYTERYMGILDGCLIKGIPQASTVLDRLSGGYYYYQLYDLFFNNLIFRHLDLKKGIQFAVEHLKNFKSTVGYWELIEFYNDIVGSLVAFFIGKDSCKNEQFAALGCLGIVKRYLIPKLSLVKGFDPQQGLFLLRESVKEIENKEIIKIEMNQEVNVKRVLYLVATDTEYERVYEFYKKKNGAAPDSVVIGDFVYRDLGFVGNVHVHLLKSSMGAKGNNGSILVVNKAITSLKPDFIIMVGIGFGLKEEEQSLGDIMVSDAIEDYGTCKIKEMEVIPRGNKIPSNAILKNRFADSKLDWNKSKVHTGLIITNDVLVNDNNLVARLKQQYPDAIGGEMEGCGLLANYSTPWILIKGICDFGHDKKNEYQEFAAMNAIEYVDLTLRRNGL